MSSKAPTAEQRQALEYSLGSMRLLELRLDPVRGTFDAAHLKEINRRIFQDLPAHGFTDVTPGQFRPAVPAGKDWLKTRTFETAEARGHVAYSRMDDRARVRLDDLLQRADPAALARLDTAAFTQAIGTLYSELDYLHPFSDGNSRTLREFTRQLAEASGYRLDWAPFGQSPVGRDLLYIARDLCVNELVVPHIVDKGTLRDVLLTQDQFDGNRRLPDLLQDAIEPLPAVASPAQSGGHSLEEPSLEQQLREQKAAELQPEANRYTDHADEPGMDM
jgi:cell filamentation protein